MKKYISLMMLYARATLGRLLAVLGLSALTEAALFYTAADPGLSLEQVLESAHLPVACAVFFILWMLILSLPSFAKADYTLRRLQVCPKGQLVFHAFYNTLCCLLFWGFQVCLLTALFSAFGTQADESIFGPQSLLFAFYRVPFLHSLLPLADVTRYLRNAALLCCLGTAAALPLSRRHQRSSQILLAAVVLIFFWAFPAQMDSRIGDIFWGIAALLFTGVSLWLPIDPNEEAVSSVPEVTAPTCFEEVTQDET